jgi:hypothetical protein
MLCTPDPGMCSLLADAQPFRRHTRPELTVAHRGPPAGRASQSIDLLARSLRPAAA